MGGNFMSGKTARACDCCVKKRARWYCPSDDAFLCQTCDGSVHAANPLARRHQRVRLKTASFNNKPDLIHHQLPSWNHGSTRKPRSQRHSKPKFDATTTAPNYLLNNPSVRNVPELGSTDETTLFSHQEDDEDQLLYRVPSLELWSTTTTTTSLFEVEGSDHDVVKDYHHTNMKSSLLSHYDDDQHQPSSDLDVIDLDTLFGNNEGMVDAAAYGVEELGLLDNSNNINAAGKDQNDPTTEDFVQPINNYKLAEEEEEEDEKMGLELSLDLGTTNSDEQVVLGFMQSNVRVECEAGDHNNKVVKKEEEEEGKGLMLRLDYEAICEAWATQGSPWLNGQPPDPHHIHTHLQWPHSMGTWGGKLHEPLKANNNNVVGGVLLGVGGGECLSSRDGGREAKVSRYREKRRTRLFAKKIRYEVRKLNAQNRPRIKGRFVKRPPSYSTITTTTSLPFLSSK